MKSISLYSRGRLYNRHLVLQFFRKLFVREFPLTKSEYYYHRTLQFIQSRSNTRMQFNIHSMLDNFHLFIS
ncbi:hypothetical protein RclHR1_03770009 [Rhizophagus clarus]|uniref:Uncharacterized protein n=1 Tax=Rhizophagus clarus TaxID=94130 RepID=A0A2Z6RUC9_9GLOM|nr:hypothetical protein RclHR1_03770009 [Rhizophagus clarus]GES85125.1 hypothetical protein RCL_jg1207.t1 [Rhizophagus clarus]